MPNSNFKTTFNQTISILILIIIFQLFKKDAVMYAGPADPEKIFTCDSCKGVIDLSLSGVNNKYNYLWSDGSTMENRNSLCSGLYSVTITDENGAVTIKEYKVEMNKAISLSAEVVNVSCNGGNDGIINLSTGDSGLYSYVWSDGEETEDIYALSPGTYTVTVTDSSLCNKSLTVNISEAPLLIIKGVIKNGNCIANATIQTEVIGGTGSYFYEWSTGANGQVVKDLLPGNYSVTVYDQYGCNAKNEFDIKPNELHVSIETDGPSCLTGLSNVTVIVEGVSEPLTYLWSNGVNNAALNNLSFGIYTVTVSSANGCSGTGVIEIKNNYQPMNLFFTSVSASCNNSNDGGIDLTLTGGMEPYSFKWSTGNESEDLLLVGGGNYKAVVTDGNGCVVSGDAAVEIPEKFTASVFYNK